MSVDVQIYPLKKFGVWLEAQNCLLNHVKNILSLVNRQICLFGLVENISSLVDAQICLLDPVTKLFVNLFNKFQS